MNGWLSVCLLATTQLVAAIWLVRRAARRWWDYLVIAALAVLLGRPLYDFIGGGVSRFLPLWLWSEGADGKDQIIIASIATTLLLPVIGAAVAWFLVRRVLQSLRRD